MKVKEKVVKKTIKSKESTKERLKPESAEKSKKRVTNNERNKIIDNSELTKNNKTDIGIENEEENEKSYKELNPNKIGDKAKPKINKNFIKKKTVSYKLATQTKETKESKEIKDLKPKKISNLPQKKKMVKGPKTEAIIKQKQNEKNSEKNLSRVDLDKRIKLNDDKDDNENNEESFNENFNKTDDNFRKNEIGNEDDNNRKIWTDSLEQSFNQSKENENSEIHQGENMAIKILKFKNSDDAKEESDEDNENEKENEEKEDKNEANKINEDNNKISLEQEKNNTFEDSKKNFNVNNNQNKLPIKEQNKKGKKAYSNFIQNIKKANKNKKNKANLIHPEPKAKFVKAVNKIKVLKNLSQDREKEKEKGKENKVQTQNENQLEDPLIEHVRNEILKENEEEQKQRQKQNDFNKKENFEEKENINISKKEEVKSGYTGFVLLKQNQGANIFQIKFEGSLEEINKIFKTHKIELERGPVELVYTKDLEDLRKRVEEKEENEILKETGNQEPLPTMRKISIEERAAKKEADDNLKIEEMKERIRIYKEELKKGDDIGIGLERRPISTYKKTTSNEVETIPKNNYANNNNANANQQLRDESNKNKAENKTAVDAPQEKKLYTKIEVEQKKDKEKDRDKSLSRAMDRFKRRYKKDNSTELKAKKSEKINEMAKQLENALGKANASAEINYESNISKDIVHEDEKEGKMDEALENQPVVSKKPKKTKQFQY